MKAVCFFAALCTIAVAAAPADAAVAFNLRRSGIIVGESITQTAVDSDFEVTLTASATGTSETPLVVQAGGLGTGVFTPNNGIPDIPFVDGRGNRETLRLTFAQAFRIDSLCFNWVDRNDSVRIKAGDTVLNFTNFGSFLDLSGQLPFAEVVELTAPNSNSEWFVTAIKGEVIPEPSTALIWSALGVGVVVWRRRRRKLPLA